MIPYDPILFDEPLSKCRTDRASEKQGLPPSMLIRADLEKSVKVGHTVLRGPNKATGTINR